MTRFRSTPWWLMLGLLGLLLGLPGSGWAQEVIPSVGETVTTLVEEAEGNETAVSVRLVMILTALSLLPGMLLVMTPFTRFVIVFSLLRQALGLQQTPPNQVIIGLSLVLSMMVMQPTLNTVNADSVQPYMSGAITTTEAVNASVGPMRSFMFDNVQRDELWTAIQLAQIEHIIESADDRLAAVPTPVLVTAFVLSELKSAFVIAVQVYIPFLVVDIIVASVLLGMGMMMLPPVVISLPFKLMVFVLMDGWQLLVTGMVGGFA